MKLVRRFLSKRAASAASILLGLLRNEKLSFFPEDIRQLRYSFSDCGEDLTIIDYLASKKSNHRGIYIDVGAFDPILISNTYLLYKSGYHGLVVDPSPVTINSFRATRPRDLAVRAALSDKTEQLLYLEYPLPGNNRLALPSSDDLKSMIGEEPIKTTSICTFTLREILVEHYPHGVQIDLLSIDCEGYDCEVLLGLDLDRYRPSLICIENDGRLTSRPAAAAEYILSHNYKMLAKLGLNTIYVDSLT